MRVIPLAVLCGLTALPTLAADSPYGAYADFIPGPDFSTIAEGTPPPTELVARLFALSFAEQCSWGLSGDPSLLMPQTYDFPYRNDFTDADAPDETLRLYRLFCGAGAYNVQSVYMSWDVSNGLRTLSFAQPTFVASQVDPENPESPLAAIEITGQSATSILINSAVDPETGTISSQSCWRGLCDASSIGIWVLGGPDYRLERFLVDPTYDGEVNHVELVDYSAGIEVPLDVVPTPELPMPEEF